MVSFLFMRSRWGKGCRNSKRCRRLAISTEPNTLSNSTGKIQGKALRSMMIKRPSNECQAELPRWSNIGVDTAPLSLCMSGLSTGPRSTLYSLRSFCSACIVLEKSWSVRYGKGDEQEVTRLDKTKCTHEAKWQPVLNMTVG